MTAWRQLSGLGRALLVAVLLTGLTTFMFLPLLAIELTAQDIPIGTVGLLVGLLAFSSQGFSLITGLLVDRFGPRPVMGVGFTLRIAGYVLLGIGVSGGTRPAALVAGILGIGIGGSLLGLAIKTQLVTIGDVPPRTMLALRATFVNIGVVAGPALGAALYPLGFQYILAACVLSHLAMGARVFTRAPRTPEPAIRKGEANLGHDRAQAPSWTWRQWTVLLALSTSYWVIYSQLNVVVPIAATAMTGTSASIAVIFTVNGVLVVIFQYTLLRHVFLRSTSRTLLVIGFLAFAGGYLAMVPDAGWYSLLLFILPVTLAEMLIGPSLDEQAITATSVRRTGSALGAMSLAGACGSLLGSGMGGYLLQVLGGAGDVWPVIIGVSSAAALASLLLPKVRVDSV